MCEETTPSPVSIPLPLSIPPKALPFRLRQHDRHVDRFGWSPFDERLFPERLLSLPQLHHLLRVSGGLATFWKESGLPAASGPQPNTDRISEDQLQSMIRTATKMISMQESHNTQALTARSNEMDELFSPWVSSNVNKFAPLSRHEKDYSGEVSTVEGSLTDMCLGESPPVSSRNSNQLSAAGLCKGGSSRSLSSGYDSDLEGDYNRTLSRRSVARVADHLQKRAVRSLSRENSRVISESETLGRSSSTFGDTSEDEKFAQGIV
jgi:hypothetical protein